MTLTITKGSVVKTLELDNINEMILDNRATGSKVYDVSKGEEVPSLEGFSAVKNFDSVDLTDGETEIGFSCTYTQIANLSANYDSASKLYNVVITLV